MVERGKNVLFYSALDTLIEKNLSSVHESEPEFGVANSNNYSRRNIRNIVLTNFLFDCGCPKWTN